MKKTNRFFSYFMESLAGFGSLAMAILFFFALYKLKTFIGTIGQLIEILMPLVYGIAIAFVLSPICNAICRKLDHWIPANVMNRRKRRTMINICGVAGAVFLALIIVYILLVLLIPQLFESVVNLVGNMDTISESFNNWANGLFAAHPDQQQQFNQIYSTLGDNLTDWVKNTMMPRLEQTVGNLSVGILGFVNVLKNLIIGLIISIYLMYNRKLYSAQLKKVLYGLCPVGAANHILSMGRHVGDVFKDFLLGKILDSAIIGVLCFAGLSLLNMPYAVLISTIVGVTNIIPYFGPFFGAIPSAFLIFTVHPIQAVYFLIFILVLQQVDGNIIGPKILGGSTGLASFWVLFSLLLFGGLFGVVGMIIGVPCFAVIYDLSGQLVNYMLRKKGMPVRTRDYLSLEYVDPLNGEIVDMKPEKEKKGFKKRGERHQWTPFVNQDFLNVFRREDAEGEMKMKTDENSGGDAEVSDPSTDPDHAE